jgi:hypothetical protein
VIVRSFATDAPVALTCCTTARRCASAHVEIRSRGYELATVGALLDGHRG